MQKMQEDQEYIRKLENCLQKFSDYRDQVENVEIKQEIKILDLVVLLFRIRIGIRKQNLLEIMMIFDRNQLFIKELMNFQNNGWIIIQQFLIIFAMCRYHQEDFKGSAVLFRKAIKISTKILSLDSFTEKFYPNPDKKMKTQVLIYFCELKLAKAMFQMTKCTKESISLEQLIIKIDGDKYLNSQQKQTIFEKFSIQFEKQKAYIGKQQSNKELETNENIGDEQKNERKDAQLDFQKLASEVTQKQNKYKQYCEQNQNKKIAFLVASKNNQKWYKNAMQNNFNIQNNTPVFNKSNQKTQGINHSSSQSQLDHYSSMPSTPLTKQSPLKSPFTKIQPQSQVRNIFIQQVNNQIQQKRNSIVNSPTVGENKGAFNMNQRRSGGRASIFSLQNAFTQIRNSGTPQNNYLQEDKNQLANLLDDEDIANLGNNLSELSITLPHDNESFMDRYHVQKNEEVVSERVRSQNQQDNIKIQKDVLLERIQIFKKRKGDTLFASGPIQIKTCQTEQFDQIQNNKEEYHEQDLQQKFITQIIPIYTVNPQQSHENQNTQIQSTIKITPSHKKSKSLQKFGSSFQTIIPQINVQQDQEKNLNLKISSADRNINNSVSNKKQRVLSAYTNKNLSQNESNQKFVKNDINQQFMQFAIDGNFQTVTKQNQQKGIHSLSIPTCQPFSSSSALISPRSSSNLNNVQYFKSISILSPRNNDNNNMSNKGSIQSRNSNFYSEKTPKELRSFQSFSNTPSMKQPAVFVNQFTSGNKNTIPTENPQKIENASVTSMELFTEQNMKQVQQNTQNNQKLSVSNLHSPEMSSFSTERTNDSRVKYRIQSMKNNSKLSNIISYDQANQIMNSRPKWEQQIKANPRNDEQVNQKMKKIKSTANLIDQIIEQSQIPMENQYANPLDAGDTPFPHIQYALKNVEQERLLQDLINKSKTCELVVEDHKQKVREIVLTKKKFIVDGQFQKRHKDLRKDSLQKHKISEDQYNDLENLDEQFNRFLQEKQKSFSLDVVDGYDKMHDEVDQQGIYSICSSSRNNSNRQKLEDQTDGIKSSVDSINQRNERFQIKYNIEVPLRSLNYSDSITQSKENNLMFGGDNLLEVQPLERSRKSSRDRKPGQKQLHQMMNTDESIRATHQIEDSGNLDDESEYLDDVPMMEDQVIDHDYSSMEFDQKKHHSKYPNIALQGVEDETSDYHHNYKINKEFQNKRSNKVSIDDISLLSPDEFTLESPKLSLATFNSIRTIVQSKLLMRKQKALSQNEIQNMMSPLPKAVIQYNDEAANKQSTEKSFPPFQFMFISPSTIELIKISYEDVIKTNHQMQYCIRLVGKYINEIIYLDLDFQGHSSLKKQLDQYTVWPLVLEGLKKQFIMQGLEDLINDKTMNDGQYLLQDNESHQIQDGLQDQTVEEINQWKSHLSLTKIIELESPQKKSFKLIQKSENLQFTRDGPSQKLRKASTYFLKSKYQLSFFTNFDKGNSKFLGDIDLMSVCSIKNLISIYISQCYQFTSKVNGRMYMKRDVQNDMNFIQSQKTIHEISKLQKALSRSQSNHSKVYYNYLFKFSLKNIVFQLLHYSIKINIKEMMPYVTDKSEQGWSIRIILYKNESSQEKKEQQSLSSSQIQIKQQTNKNEFKESELKLSRREKYFFHYWLKHQKNSVSKEKDLKFKLSEFLIEKKDNVIFYLNQKLSSMSLIGSFIKRQYITNTFFLIEVYLTHKKNQEIVLFQTIDKYCKIKDLPFIIQVQGRSVETLQKIQPLEIPVEILLNIFQHNEMITSFTQLMLTGSTKKYFKRKLLQYISENIYIIISNFIDRKAQQKADNQAGDHNRVFKQLKIVFQSQKNEEKNIFQDNPQMIFQDLPQIFSERIKQHIEPTLYEKMFEKLFNEIYEKNFLNRKNVDIDSIFESLQQQNSSLKKNVLQENDITDDEEENNNNNNNNNKNKNGVLQVYQNNSIVNLNLIGEDGLPPSNNMEDSDPNLLTNEDQTHFQYYSKKNISRDSRNVYGRGFLAPSSTSLSIQARNSIKSLQVQRKKILRSIKKIQDIQNNQLIQPNQQSSMLSLDSSFVSTQNNLQGSFYFNDNNLIIMKQEQMIENLKTNIKKIDYYMDWQNNGLYGRFLIQLNEYGKQQLKIANFLPKGNFIFDQITQKQMNIVVNILTYVIDMKVNESKPMVNRQILLRYMLQNIVLKDYQSLTGFRFIPRKPTEYGTHQLILSNNNSVQYHLSLQTKEFLQQYYNQKQTFSQNISNIGRSLVVACSFSINVKDITNKYQILFSVSILPLNQKTTAHRVILSLQDMQSMDPYQVQRIISSKMATTVVHKSFKNILKKSVFLSTSIGKLPIFHYTQTVYSTQQGTPQTSKIRSYKTTTYDGKKISGIYSRNNQRLKTLQNNSNFEDFVDSSSNPTKNPKNQGDDDIFQWLNHLNNLRCYRNSMTKLNFDQKVYENNSNQNFLNEDVIRYRFIYSMSKTFQNEYILVSVFRDLLLQNWLIKFYFPRNCRYLQCHVDSSDLFQASSRFLKRAITNQLIWFYEYEYTEIFSNYLDLQRRLNIKGISHKQMRQIEKEKFSPSPLFYNKKGNLFLNKTKLLQSRQAGSIFSQMLENPVSRSSTFYQKSPLQSPSPSPLSQSLDNSINNSKYDIQSPYNLNLSRFYAENQAANTIKSRKPVLTVRTNNNTGRNQQILIQNENTVDSQYDLSSSQKKSKKITTSQHQGSFFDYLCKYMQSERQLSPNVQQIHEKNIFDRNVVNSERIIQNQRNGTNMNLSLNEDMKNTESPLNSFSSSVEYEKQSPFLKKQKQLNPLTDGNDFDGDNQQRFLKSRLQKIKFESSNKLSTLMYDTEEKEELEKFELNPIKQQSQNKQKKSLKDIILKHFLGVKIVNNLKSIVEYIKPRRHDKVNRIEKLKNMTLLQDHSFEETIKQIDRTKNTRAKKEQILIQKKQEKNQKYYEIKIWENFINLINLKHTCMQIDLGGTGIALKEILVSKFLRIDKVINKFILGIVLFQKQ